MIINNKCLSLIFWTTVKKDGVVVSYNSKKKYAFLVRTCVISTRVSEYRENKYSTIINKKEAEHILSEGRGRLIVINVNKLMKSFQEHYNESSHY